MMNIVPKECFDIPETNALASGESVLNACRATPVASVQWYLIYINMSGKALAAGNKSQRSSCKNRRLAPSRSHDQRQSKCHWASAIGSKENQRSFPKHVHTLFTCCVVALLCSSAFAQKTRPLVPIAAKLEPTRLEVYKTVDEQSLRLHIFEPDGHRATDHRPVFLIIHGGGWTGGNPRQFYPFAEQFAQAGMIGISLEYRLLNRARGTTVFDCVKDGRSAIRYLRRNANKLGIDPNRIVVAGGSAGGHVAVATALFENVNEAGEETSVSANPNAIVLYYPVIDTSENGYGQKKIGESWKELSPVHNVRQGLPPTILFHGTGDTVTPFAGAAKFQRQMKAAGNHCELIRHEGGAHGYLIFDLKRYEQTIKRTKQFLTEQKMIPQD